MSIVFLLSVILKGFGAVLEVLLQVMITRMMGLAGYGTYSTWVSAADLVYWVLFSGITKCNTFYLSNKGTELRRFKAKYYSRYVLPVLVGILFTLLHALIQAYVLTMLTALFYGEVYQRSEPASGQK